MDKRLLALASAILSLFIIITGGIFWYLKTQEKKKEPPPPVVIEKKEPSFKEQLAAQKTIKKFSTYQAMADFLDTLSSNNGSSYFSSRAMMGEMETAMPPPTTSFDRMETSSLLKVAQSPTALDYSKTNVQVEGVDEADIIKTDGNYIYALVRKKLIIMKSSPASGSAIVSSIALDSRPQELFINDNRLVVFGRDEKFSGTEIYKTFRRRSSYSFLKIFDISDRTAPKELRTFRFEGDYFTSRMIGDYVYLVTNLQQYGYQEDSHVLPRILDAQTIIPNECGSNEACFAPNVYYFDIPYQSSVLTTISALNIKDSSATPKGDVYLLPSAENLYVSQKALYITYTKQIQQELVMMEILKELIIPKLPEKSKARIDAIEKADDYVLTKYEKINKISVIAEQYIASLSESEQETLQKETEDSFKKKIKELAEELEKTVVHKITIEKDQLKHEATGEVKGHVLNQFSMDEDSDGYFRIATTKSREWLPFEDEESKESYSNVFILDGNMSVVGGLEKLAKGEQIYSARFMQKRAYLVTFKQTDPLFVIDLSDPKNPSVLGELKIPGFSSYLHPYDDTTLIGLGYDTKENEWGGIIRNGVKLSLFDVSTVTAPKEIDSFIVGEDGSSSIAAEDHKAFLFSRERNLLVIPVSLMETKEKGWKEFTFGGALVFSIDKKGLKLRGRIDHSDSGAPSEQDYWMGYSYFDNTVKRSLYINDALFTFSQSYLKAHSLKDLSEIKSIKFEKEKNEKKDSLLQPSLFQE